MASEQVAGVPVSKPDKVLFPDDRYTIGSVLRRLAQRDDPWSGMGEHARALDDPRRRLQERADSLGRH